MHDEDCFFVDDALHRHALSQRNEPNANADGPLTPDLQAQSPGEDKEPNRLPAPKDEFILKLRRCRPNDEPPTLPDGSRKILEVKQAS